MPYIDIDPNQIRVWRKLVERAHRLFVYAMVSKKRDNYELMELALQAAGRLRAQASTILRHARG